jgi:hypothetical protein
VPSRSRRQLAVVEDRLHLTSDDNNADALGAAWPSATPRRQPWASRWCSRWSPARQAHRLGHRGRQGPVDRRRRRRSRGSRRRQLEVAREGGKIVIRARRQAARLDPVGGDLSRHCGDQVTSPGEAGARTTGVDLAAYNADGERWKNDARRPRRPRAAQLFRPSSSSGWRARRAAARQLTQSAAERIAFVHQRRHLVLQASVAASTPRRRRTPAPAGAKRLRCLTAATATYDRDAFDRCRPARRPQARAVARPPAGFRSRPAVTSSASSSASPQRRKRWATAARRSSWWPRSTRCRGRRHQRRRLLVARPATSAHPASGRSPWAAGPSRHRRLGAGRPGSRRPVAALVAIARDRDARFDGIKRPRSRPRQAQGPDVARTCSPSCRTAAPAKLRESVMSCWWRDPASRRCWWLEPTLTSVTGPSRRRWH